MSRFTFNVVDANNQVGQGSMQIGDTRYKNYSAVEMEQLIGSGILSLDDNAAPSIQLQGIVYEVTPRPTQHDVSQLSVGSYSITVRGTLSLLARPVQILNIAKA